MPYETGLLVGGRSIVTACVAKLKCYVKQKWCVEFWVWFYR